MSGFSGNDHDVGVFTPNNPAPASAGVVLQERAPTPSPSKQTQQQTAIHNGNVTAADVSLHDSAGAAITENNPFPVVIVEGTPGGVTETPLTVTSKQLVSSGGTQSLFIYTVPADVSLTLIRIPVSGENIGSFDLNIDGSWVESLHTSYAASLNACFEFSIDRNRGPKYAPGSTFEIVAKNNGEDDAYFNARLQAILVDNSI